MYFMGSILTGRVPPMGSADLLVGVAASFSTSWVLDIFANLIVIRTPGRVENPAATPTKGQPA
jgi:hypothetical protein